MISSLIRVTKLYIVRFERLDLANFKRKILCYKPVYLKFVLILFLFDILPVIFNFLSSDVYSKGFAFRNSLSLFTPVTIFMNIFLVYVIFYYILCFIDWVFRIRHKIIFCYLIALYLFTYEVLTFPQIFDDLFFLNNVIPWIVENVSYSVVYITSALLLVFLSFEFFKYRKADKTFRQIGLFLLVISGLIVYFFGIQSYNRIKKELSEAGYSINKEIKFKHNKKNIILIGVDGLRADANIVDHNFKSLNFIQNNSFTFDKVISPVARTHASFMSIFTGNSSFRHKVNDNLLYPSDYENILLENSYLKDFKKNGYRIILMVDDNKFSKFKEGSIFDEVIQPDTDIANIILPDYFRNRLYFGFFNNKFGHFLFSLPRDNAAYYFAYKLNSFSDKVVDKINILANSQEPFVFIVHSCALHWPGSSVYPFINTIKKSDSFPFYSYVQDFFPRDFVSVNSSYSSHRVEQNERIYNKSVQKIIEQYLAPISDSIIRSGLVKNSVVSIFSDHGESLGKNANLITSNDSPQHGRSLLFGEDSNLSSLSLYIPELKGGKIRGNVGLVDLLPTFLETVGIETLVRSEGTSFYPSMMNKSIPLTDKYLFAESAWSHTKSFLSEFKFVRTYLPEFLKYDPDNDLLYTDPFVRSLIRIESHKALYFKDYRLTLVLTNFGPRIFVCNLKENPDCMIQYKFAGDDVNSTANLLLKKIGNNDFPINFLKNPSERNIAWNSNNSIFPINLLKSSELIYRDREFKKGVIELFNILDNIKGKPWLEYIALSNIHEVCNLGLIDQDFLKNELDPVLVRNFAEVTNFLSIGFSQQHANCLKNIGYFSEADKLERLYKDNSDSGYLNWAFFSEQIKNGKFSEKKLVELLRSAKKNSQYEWSILNALFERFPSEEYSRLYENHNLMKGKSNLIKIYYQIFRIKKTSLLEIQDLISEIKIYFKTELSYQLPDDLYEYHRLMFILLGKTNNVELQREFILDSIAQENVTLKFLGRYIQPLLDKHIKSKYSINNLSFNGIRKVIWDTSHKRKNTYSAADIENSFLIAVLAKDLNHIDSMTNSNSKLKKPSLNWHRYISELKMSEYQNYSALSNSLRKFIETF